MVKSFEDLLDAQPFDDSYLHKRLFKSKSGMTDSGVTGELGDFSVQKDQSSDPLKDAGAPPPA